MITDEKLLWKQIDDFPLNDSAPNFTSRLAQENKWPAYFADRVTTAYKKFLFLCMVSPQQVTPSDAVDQAWHLHMTYTESYWTDLCARTLGKPLHHHPTKGGPEEKEKFFYQYDATLLLYEEKFEEVPPEDIWPPAEQRFAGSFVRVDTSTNWVIKKPKRKNLATSVALNAVGLVVGLASANWAFMVITAIAGIALMFPSIPGTGSPGGCGGGCGSGCGGDSGCGSGCGGGCGD